MYKWAEMLQQLGGSLAVEMAQNGWTATVTIYGGDGEDHVIHGGDPLGESQLRTVMERLGERLESHLHTGTPLNAWHGT